MKKHGSEVAQENADTAKKVANEVFLNREGKYIINRPHAYWKEIPDSATLSRKELIAIIQSAIDAATKPVWIKTSDQLPTEEDANKDGDILAIRFLPNDEVKPILRHWGGVVEFQQLYQCWMKIPPVPKAEETPTPV